MTIYGSVPNQTERTNDLNASLREAVERCDLCVVDLDQCIYPRFTQTTLGALLLLSALHPSRWRLLPRLLRGAAYIIKTRMRGFLFGVKPSNRDLMTAFIAAIRGWPLDLLERYSLQVPRTGPGRWREALSRVAARMPVYLFTFSIEPLASAYGRVTDKRGETIFRGWRGSPMSFREGRVEEISCPPDSFSGRTKLKWLEELLVTGNYHRPLIIGHSPDEALMARRARELGGSSIGRKGGESQMEFDFAIKGYPWKLVSLVLGRDDVNI